MKKLTLREDNILGRIDEEKIGNGRQSRLDIYLDKSDGEVWALEFYDHESNSWNEYHDEDIVKVGTAHNFYVEDEDDNDTDGLGWNITIYAPEGNNDTYIAGDVYNSG